MIGGAVVLLARGLVGQPAAAGARQHHRQRHHLGRRLRDRHLAVVRRPGPRRAHLHRPRRRDGRLQRAHHHARRRGHAAHRAGGRRLSQTRGHHGRGVPRPGPDVGLGRHVDGLGQRPDHHLPRPRDPLHRPLRPDRVQPPPGRLGRGGAQVLPPRRVLLGHLRLRHRPHLRRHRVDQPDPDRRLPLQERRADQRAPPGRPGPHAGRLRLQGGRGAVPHVDARRLRGGAHPGDRLHGRRGQGGGVRRPAAGALLLARRHLHRLEADHLRAGRAVAARRVRGRPAPARRQAHAGLLVDQPRRVHPARRGVGAPRAA